MQIVNDFLLPAKAARTNAKKGSQFFPKEVKELTEKLQIGQGFVIPLLDGLEKTDDKYDIEKGLDADGKEVENKVYKKGPKHHLQGVKWYCKQHFKDTEKEFAMGIMDNGDIGVKRVK
jgi:hypothetical protein